MSAIININVLYLLSYINLLYIAFISGEIGRNYHCGIVGGEGVALIVGGGGGG